MELTPFEVTERGYTSGNILVLEHYMHGILRISGKLRRLWTCDLANYFCHLSQDWSVFVI
jgi:hypothetical protein